ncbi:MAG: LysE family translocator, partial [Pseudomonadota bacterium]
VSIVGPKFAGLRKVNRMDVLVTLATVFAVFIPALMLPGPDFIAVVRASLAHGGQAGLLTTLGVSLGLGFYATLSLLGLSALLIEYQWLTWTVRILGGAYLIYLGLRLIWSKPVDLDIKDDLPTPHNRMFWFGFLVTLTNPKAIVLFASVFATAVSPVTPGWVLLLMIALVVSASVIWYSLVSLFMASGPIAGRFKALKHWIERAAGFCFIGIGGKVLADSRNPITP